MRQCLLNLILFSAEERPSLLLKEEPRDVDTVKELLE